MARADGPWVGIGQRLRAPAGTAESVIWTPGAATGDIRRWQRPQTAAAIETEAKRHRLLVAFGSIGRSGRRRTVGRWSGLPRPLGCEADMSAGQETRHRNAFERAMEALGTGLGNGIGWLAEHGVLVLVYGFVWAAVGAGLLLSQTTVTEAWTVIGSQNLVVQAMLWLLFLPVMAGLWVWHTDWPVLVRALLVVGLAGWNVLVFMPRPAGQPAPSASDDQASAGG